jgi:anthranilate synthase/aminodeoxychorismate synthase-like glutamine amidotransferase
VRVLVVDNYDSFTYNLVQMLGCLGVEPIVRRNNVLTVSEALQLGVERIVISPGPGTPADAGISCELVRVGGSTPLLGVCMGHECIAVALGGSLRPARALVHGKTSPIYHDGSGLFAGLPSPFEAARYHSWVVDETTLPRDLEVTARADCGQIMGLRHHHRPLEGVQFHPESFATEHGLRMLERFVATQG